MSEDLTYESLVQACHDLKAGQHYIEHPVLTVTQKQYEAMDRMPGGPCFANLVTLLTHGAIKESE